MPDQKNHNNTERPSIPLVDDELVTDADFRRDFLRNCNRRTASRYDSQGLPYVYIAGKKMRPVRAGMEWLAARIVTRNPRRSR